MLLDLVQMTCLSCLNVRVCKKDAVYVCVCIYMFILRPMGQLKQNRGFDYYVHGLMEEAGEVFEAVRSGHGSEPAASVMPGANLTALKKGHA